MPRYYAQGSHPAIVSREVHDLVQHEFWRRRESSMRTTGWSKTGRACFAGKIVCGDCGSFYGSKVWHSTDKYRRVIWQCDHKFLNKEKCRTPHLTEKQIEAAFVETMNGIIGNKDEILAAYDVLIAELTDTTAFEEKGKTAREQCQNLYARMQAYINENASKALDQDEYKKNYEAMNAQYCELKAQIAALEGKQLEMRARRAKLEAFMKKLRGMDGLLVGFDEGLFVALVESVTVGRDGKMTFRFADGTEKPRDGSSLCAGRTAAE